LQFAATTEGGRLEFLDTSSRAARVTALVRRAVCLQADDPAFRSETAKCAERDPESVAGGPAMAFGPPADRSPNPSLCSPRENRLAAPWEPGRDPVLAAVLTRDRGAAAEVRAGMVLQRVLLTATADGLPAAFLSQPFETPSTRGQLLKLFHSLGQAHTLLGIGYGLPVPMTERRPVADVTIRAGEIRRSGGLRSGQARSRKNAEDVLIRDHSDEGVAFHHG
jgi:hypothetical protein